MTQTAAKVIADSISPDGVRLTTGQVTLPRRMLSELNTHRTFSRNSESSRAVPAEKRFERVLEDPCDPLVWPSEQPGMQGGEPLSGGAQYEAETVWLAARQDALRHAKRLRSLGHDGDERLHKSVVNRLLEPFLWHTVIITATAWENFFALRLDKDADPEIRAAAEAMRAAMDASTPQPLREDQAHLPYIRFGEDDYDVASHLLDLGIEPTPDLVRKHLAAVSAARCARVSYLTHDGRRDIAADLRLYDRLVTDRLDRGLAIHWSPLEHVAYPWAWNRQEGCIHFGQEEHLVGIEDTFTCIPLDHLPRVGNLLGWRSLRTTVEAQNKVRTFV